MSDEIAGAAHTLRPDKWYSVPGLGQEIKSGSRPIYHVIRTGELKAATINDRGDLRILGAWALAWLESRATTKASPSSVSKRSARS